MRLPNFGKFIFIEIILKNIDRGTYEDPVPTVLPGSKTVVAWPMIKDLRRKVYRSGYLRFFSKTWLNKKIILPQRSAKWPEQLYLWAYSNNLSTFLLWCFYMNFRNDACTFLRLTSAFGRFESLALVLWW